MKSVETAEPAYERDVVLSHPEWKRFVQRTARVVYIVEQVHSRCGVGFLSIFPDGNPNFAKFSPTDPCVPRMKIPKDQCPKDFFVRPQDYTKLMYVCKISKWEQGRDSVVSQPFGAEGLDSCSPEISAKGRHY